MNLSLIYCRKVEETPPLEFRVWWLGKTSKVKTQFFLDIQNKLTDFAGGIRNMICKE